MSEHRCEFAFCRKPATCYGGWPEAGSWAGYACDWHATAPGFRVWDQVVPSVYAETRAEARSSLALGKSPRKGEDPRTRKGMGPGTPHAGGER